MVFSTKTTKEDQEVCQLVLPQECHKTALQGLHDNASHLGIEKTLNFVWEQFSWSKMAKDVEDYVKSPQVAPVTPIQATHPLQFVRMGYLTVEKAMGYENILVIVDHFTKFAQAYPTKNQKAATTAKFVLDFIQ